MDEGFNTYMNGLSTADERHARPMLDALGQRYGASSGRQNLSRCHAAVLSAPFLKL